MLRKQRQLIFKSAVQTGIKIFQKNIFEKKLKEGYLKIYSAIPYSLFKNIKTYFSKTTFPACISH